MTAVRCCQTDGVSQHPDNDAQWWYNHKTGEVEFGRQSLGGDRDGPYSSREEAERAPEIARERAEAWARDEAESD